MQYMQRMQRFPDQAAGRFRAALLVMALPGRGFLPRAGSALSEQLSWPENVANQNLVEAGWHGIKKPCMIAALATVFSLHGVSSMSTSRSTTRPRLSGVVSIVFLLSLALTSLALVACSSPSSSDASGNRASGDHASAMSDAARSGPPTSNPLPESGRPDSRPDNSESDLAVSTLPASSPPPPVRPFNETDALEKARLLVLGASSGQISADRVFPGPSGLVGIVTGGPNRQVVWMTADGQVVFPGAALTASGDNISDKALVEQNVRMSPEDALTQAASDRAKSFLVGTAGPVLTVFVDANCGFCKKIYDDLMPRIERGDLRARFVMVSILREDSMYKSMRVILSDDPAAELASLKVNTSNAVTEPTGEGAAQARQTVQDNTQLLGEFTQRATPSSLFCNQQGQVEVLNGAPDLDTVVARFSETGHPACSG